MDKKKISFFIPTLSAGGIEANTIRLAKGFLRDGYQVDLVVSNSQGDYKERIPSEISIIDFDCKGIISTLPKLINYIKAKKPSVLISASEGANIVASISKLFVRKTLTKIIISIRTHLTTEYKETSSKKKRLLPILSRLFYPKVDGIVAVSKGVAEDAAEFLNIPIQRMNVIYNPIVDDSIETLSVENVDHPFFIDDRDFPIILGAGRLTKQKDFKTLLYAFKEVRSLIRCKLIIIGEGEERERLEALIKELGISEDTELTGFVQNPYSYMKNADLFVLSSAWEGFGNVIVEAMATGTNVVSTNCPSGPSEILDNGTYGELVEVGDYKTLSESIIKALKKPKSQDILKSRANYFSVTTALNQYKKLSGL
ncbi:glycosyltransferase [Caldibacillus thermoamylovorans]|uniref:Glycosyltransferase n=1 Tax=Caldibacillus thermoamylovorans TaxID=35841 RepID=A0ABD4A2N8_9BACI|nr:glycosyltransferase [Caldibacillus thermoamylovorans]KIO70371.1 hypothetical protein B4166_1621 [Caldibacillus thermoamylovorans]KIO70541.1 hypothetical protein B4167_3855 [Caldibacillus thermoamylovorans]